MAWNMTAVEAPASAVKLSLEQIGEDVVNGVEEGFAYCQANPTQRLVVSFADTDTRDLNRAAIRSYCEVRPKGRLTASIWAITVDPKTGETSTEAGSVPALSVRFSAYAKREKKATVTTDDGKPSS